ncbi:MAG: integrase core domain-containing protein [Actinomycetota bacterium]|nr:integrase core domain-containing protein [Actinomycetota bacterium]
MSRSGYDWISRPPSARDIDDAHLLNVIIDVHRAARGTYGARRVHAELTLGRRLSVGRGRVERLMRCQRLMGSIGKVACAYDNSLMESFFGSMQIELLDRRTWATRADLANAIFEWIEAFYNPIRRHTALGYRTPIDFEQLHTTASSAA